MLGKLTAAELAVEVARISEAPFKGTSPAWAYWLDQAARAFALARPGSAVAPAHASFARTRAQLAAVTAPGCATDPLYAWQELGRCAVPLAHALRELGGYRVERCAALCPSQGPDGQVACGDALQDDGSRPSGHEHLDEAAANVYGARAVLEAARRFLADEPGGGYRADPADPVEAALDSFRASYGPDALVALAVLLGRASFPRGVPGPQLAAYLEGLYRGEWPSRGAYTRSCFLDRLLTLSGGEPAAAWESAAMVDELSAHMDWNAYADGARFAEVRFVERAGRTHVFDDPATRTVETAVRPARGPVPVDEPDPRPTPDREGNRQP
jgi:hypothetical protein